MTRVDKPMKDDFPISFKVEELFDRFTHDIPLPSSDKPVRYLSAPNGYGKSTALQIIDDLGHQYWPRLARTYFARATLAFESGRSLTVERTKEAETHVLLKFTLSAPGHEDLPDTLRIPTGEPLPNFNVPRRMSRAAFHYYHELLSRGNPGDDVPARTQVPHATPDRSAAEKNLLPAIAETLAHVSVYYLDAQRLRTQIREESLQHDLFFDGKGSRDEDSITELSARVAQMLRHARFVYGQAGRQAERTFPARVLRALKDQTFAQPANPEGLEKRYSDLRQKESLLRELSLTDGMMDEIPDVYFHADGPAVAILGQYLNDIEDRFRRLERNARQLSVFRDTLNGMLEGKTVRFIADGNWTRNRQGLRVETIDGRTIPLASLSSGEQHLVVMFGRILFHSRLRKNGLVLLDEPEISLHPEWQTALSRALRQVAKVNKCRMLLATHSPTMIDNEWDDEIDLTKGQGA